MEKIKNLTTLSVPVFLLGGLIYNIVFFSMFDLDVLQYMDILDVISTAILPSFSMLILPLIYVWVKPNSLMLKEEDISDGKFIRKWSWLILIIGITLWYLFIKKMPELNYVVVVPLTEVLIWFLNAFRIPHFFLSDKKVRMMATTAISFTIIGSIFIARQNAQNIIDCTHFKYTYLLQNDGKKKLYKVIGFRGDRHFLTDLSNNEIIILEKAEKLVIYNYELRK